VKKPSTYLFKKTDS